ncbi:hypothetical protein NDU88_005953 [Pleurodeles waltl]|uniref:Uncharacterized protein n=1 Tax=Pleurodeles waltl TaxID=8319 RepID=A0AAV7NNV3_PLEWA|nr:hypothetical protein NDU88_005953 [Pleurodeles waltl]
MLAALRFKFGLAGNRWCDSAWTVNWLLSSAINFLVMGTKYCSRRLVKLTAALPGPLKVNMAPKTIRNFGDKGEGVQSTRVGKDSGDAAPAGRRPASGATKPCGKNKGGTAKDGKNATGIPPPDSRGKDKLQPVIMCLLTAGTQESGFESSLSPPKDTPVSTKENCKSIREETAHAKESKVMSCGSNSPLIRLQGAEGWLTEGSGNVDEQRAPNGEEAKASSSSTVQSQPVEPNSVAHATQDAADTPPAICLGDPTGGMYVVKHLEVEARKIGRRKKVPDWSNDGGDKF